MEQKENGHGRHDQGFLEQLVPECLDRPMDEVAPVVDGTQLRSGG